MEKMRVFLVQTAQGLTPSSGGYKANISLLRQLRSFGHECAQICYAYEKEAEQSADRAATKGVEPNLTKSVVHIVDTKGTNHELLVVAFKDVNKIHNVALCRDPYNAAYPCHEFFYDIKDYLEGRTITRRLRALVQLFTAHIVQFRPTHVIFNDALTMRLTYDLTKVAKHLPFSSVCEQTLHFKRIAVIHTAEQLPFGPYSAKIFGHCTSPAAENMLLRGLDGVWSVSKAIKDYAWNHGQLKTACMVHSTLSYLDKDTGVLPRRRNNVDKFEIGMVNPCPHKGLSILLGLAKRMPQVNFVTWRSWGSNETTLEQLRALPNIAIEKTTSNTDEIWDRIRILIAPSVWLEAWGMIVTEAQLRGVPVVASNARGLAEAKIGIPYCIPVNLLTGEKEPNGDYKVPDQDFEPWVAAIDKLMTDDEEYQKLATLTAEKSTEWLYSLDEHQQEKWLLEMMENE